MADKNGLSLQRSSLSSPWRTRLAYVQSDHPVTALAIPGHANLGAASLSCMSQRESRSRMVQGNQTRRAVSDLCASLFVSVSAFSLQLPGRDLLGLLTCKVQQPCELMRPPCQGLLRPGMLQTLFHRHFIHDWSAGVVLLQGSVLPA